MSILNKAARGLPLLLSLISANGWATTLAEALSAAESYSAELSANDHQVNALKNRADSAMQLPDPKLKFGIENVPLGGNNASRLTREGMTMQRVGVMQDYVSCGEVIVYAWMDRRRENSEKPYGTRLVAGQAVSARLVGK